jgi:hypothetical protein
MRHASVSLLPVLLFVAALPGNAGESPYNPGGASSPAGQAPTRKPPIQDYVYYCYSRSVDRDMEYTEYRTDIFPEPSPYTPGFIAAASQAWQQHMDQTVGRQKTVGQCYEGPASSAKPAWETAWKQQASSRKPPVHVDWHFG